MASESKKNSPLLSVCVPTYNRPKEFRRMMTGLLPQLTAETELVIRDDSPNDETKKVFDELFQKFNPPIRVDYCQGEKIGLDAANLFLLERATGEYIWWFSDDDEFLPGAIARVLALVKQYPEIDFVWVNYGFGSVQQLAVDWPDGFFQNSQKALEKIGPNIGLLSTLFLRRKKGLKSLPLARKHTKGFSFAALVPVFDILADAGRSYFLRGPFVLHSIEMEKGIAAMRKVVASGGEIKNAYFDYFGVDFYKILKEFDDRLGKKFVKKILAANFSSLWRGMLVGWVGGWDTPKGKRWRMFKLYWNFPEFWLAIVPFLLPLWINKGLYRIYKVFFSHRHFRFHSVKSSGN